MIDEVKQRQQPVDWVLQRKFTLIKNSKWIKKKTKNLTDAKPSQAKSSQAILSRQQA